MDQGRNLVTWARFDDRYHDNRKIKRAWRAHPRAVGLHAMAVTYCAMHETDGIIDVEWLEEKLPAGREREQVIAAMVETGLFEVLDDGSYLVHDYLVFNPSSDDLADRRRRDSERKRGRAPNGIRAESEWTPNGIHAPRVRAPAPAARPGPSRPAVGESTDMSSPTENGESR